jgi:large subunit ribosomal protein L31e
MERTYIIPLRKEWLKVPMYSRSRKATKATRSFLQKHMKVDIVKIGKHLNMKIWARGNRNPPHKIEVIATKVEDKEKGTYVFAEIPGAPVEVKKEAKKKTGGNLMDKFKSKIVEPEKNLDKKPVEDMTKKEVAKEEERLEQKEAKKAPKTKAAPKNVNKPQENKGSSSDIKATLQRSDKKR